MILVSSAPGDGHAEEVLAKLAEQSAPCRLLDLSSFPQHLALTAGDLSHTTGLHIPVDAGVAAAFLR